MVVASQPVPPPIMVYPAQGQSPEQLERDRYDCHIWAVQQTGFDPSRPGLPPGDYLALRVVGDSMNLIAPEGAVIIVDRADTLLQPRGYYVFATPDHAEATFKRWMSRPDRLEPYSTNPAHEAIYLESPPTVIGRVRKVMLDL